MPSVHNPQDVSIGSTDISGVESIEWHEQRPEIVSPAGDGEVYRRTVEYGSALVHGRMVFSDPARAAVAAGKFGTLTATLEGIGGADGRTLTITGVKTGGSRNTAGHNRTADCDVPFLAAGGQGTVGPVTLS